MKKKQTALLLALLLPPFAISTADVYLKVVQPYENANLPYVKQSFVFGSVLPATATLTINGTTVVPYSNGGFLTMIPFQEGKFTIEAVATDGVNVSSVARVVNVAAAPPVFTEDSSRFEALAPKSRVVLRVGDTLDLSCQGAPGGAASFKFVDGGEYIPMEEYSKPRVCIEAYTPLSPPTTLTRAIFSSLLSEKTERNSRRRPARA
jgi:hypothetical protein